MSTHESTDVGKPGAEPGGPIADSRGASASRSRPQNLSIDDIMWRVRVELARRNGQTGLAIPTMPVEIRSFAESLPKWKSPVPRPAIKDAYVLTELLAFADADFIDVAYRTVLRRPPDETGFDYYVQLLRTGAATKVEILGMLHSSPEGETCGVRIHGLRSPYALQRWRRKPFIGPIIAWLHAFLRLGTLADRQATAEASQARETYEAGRFLNEASQYLMQRIAALKVQLAGFARTTEFEALKSEHAATVARLAALDALEGRLRAAEASVQHLLMRKQPEIEAPRALDSFYAALENRFRGDRSVIRARVEPYLALVREAGAGTPEAPVVDIGCGRGEWLELLRDNRLIGRGIDANRVFIDICKGLGLDVIEGDAVESLRAMPDGSAGAITSIHVVEHLPFERVIALLDEARRVLRPGGLIILETPNPENLSVGHHLFYMDPTHRNPLPPEALRWIVEARGFDGARIERLMTARELNAPPVLPEDVPGAVSINAVLASLNVAPDYAIVARRP